MHQPCQNAAAGASARGRRDPGNGGPYCVRATTGTAHHASAALVALHHAGTRYHDFAIPEEVLMPSFDIVSEVNPVEVRNALDQANKEISTRFDFKGSDARVEQAEKVLTLYADDDFKLKQVADVLVGKLAKRQVDIRALEYGAIEKISGNKVKQVVTVRAGVDQERAKKIVKMLKDSKLKVQASIQGDAVRVSGAKKDELQNAIALVRKSVTDYPLQYRNFRD